MLHLQLDCLSSNISAPERLLASITNSVVHTRQRDSRRIRGSDPARGWRELCGIATADNFLFKDNIRHDGVDRGLSRYS